MPLSLRRELINVKGDDSVEIEVASTARGPLIASTNYTSVVYGGAPIMPNADVSIRWVG